MCTVVLHWSIQKIVQKGRSREALLVRYHSHGVSSHQRLREVVKTHSCHSYNCPFRSIQPRS